MIRLRTISLALAVAFGVAMAPQAVEAQLSFGAHVTRANDLPAGEETGGNDGAFGLGARVGINPPLFPLAFYATGDVFFPDCGTADCGYQTAGLAANFSFLPLPIFNLYATGGAVLRRFSVEDVSNTYTGVQLGAGVSFNFIASAYLEVVNEFVGDDGGGNQLMIRLGLGF